MTTSIIVVPASFVGWARDRSGRCPRPWRGARRGLAQGVDEADVWRRLQLRTAGLTVDLAVLPCDERPRLGATGDAGPRYRRHTQNRVPDPGQA
jgi:hypothetical protein